MKQPSQESLMKQFGNSSISAQHSPDLHTLQDSHLDTKAEQKETIERSGTCHWQKFLITHVADVGRVVHIIAL